MVSLLLMASLPLDTWLRLIVWLLIGFAIYFGYSRKHSRVQTTQASQITPSATAAD
jgi:APA family basic amino acid/polyamine antiporter